jgi:hypothetical protein
MFPVDIDVRRTQTNIGHLVEKLKEGIIIYIEFGTVDARFFELCWSNLRLDPLIVRAKPSLDKQLDENHTSRGIEVYRGRGLIETIVKYIIEDLPIKGLEMMTEYNGKRYSELPRRFQRKIEETYIDIYADLNFYGTDDDRVTTSYCEILHNLT